MFQRILVGLDGSPLGRQAFQVALELAEMVGGSFQPRLGL
jgi:nucleotide-binding universal stress UspA family protein